MPNLKIVDPVAQAHRFHVTLKRDRLAAVKAIRGNLKLIEKAVRARELSVEHTHTGVRNGRPLMYVPTYSEVQLDIALETVRRSTQDLAEIFLTDTRKDC